VEVADFDFSLPEELIAQQPLAERDASRLLVLPRAGGPVEHRMARELPQLLRPGDLLVVNDARVIPARLRGRKQGSGGKVELLLIEPLAPFAPAAGTDSPARGETGNSVGPEWLALGQASRALKAGQAVEIGPHLLEVLEARGGGELRVRLPAALAADERLFDFLEESGELPLPPYIQHAPSPADRERYQTLFARVRGAIAAPTAGLHFTPALLDGLRARGVTLAPVTLHVGPGTFLPVRVDKTEDHRMHRERYDVPSATADACARTRAAGGRVIAIGTTALRTLEAAFDDDAGRLREGPGSTDLFCTPGYRFRAVDGLFTNFHLPKSTLLMLVAAFAGLDRVLDAYRIAVEQRYRFFSYGDAMLIS
jgi:S-adenosylmethionine:tRNA ribosyltransferase-isomerase